MVLNPQIIKKNGKKEFVVIPYEEFLALQEALEDYEDLRELREAKEDSKNEASIPLDKVIADMNLK
ncbi:MAG TPA: type II toxin-antitoxin system Phd/YefM family antitoxin [bacterium]